MSGAARPARILHLVTRYLRGGSEQRVRDFVAALDDADHTVVVGSDSDLARAREQLGVRVELEQHLVRDPDPVHDVLAVRAVRARLRREPADLVVTHQSKAGVVGRLAARSVGVPAVHSLSMASFGPGYSKRQSAVFRAVERALAGSTARYAVVGADLAHRFEAAGVPGDRFAIVRSAATLPRPRPAVVPAVAGVPADRPVVLSLGAIEPRKHPLDLVPMLARLQETVPDAFLAVAGTGPLERELADAVRDAGLTDDVALLGYVTPVEPLLWRADALVLMSDAEGLPQVLVQAAAARVPWVSFAVDGAREVRNLGAVGRIVERDPGHDVGRVADELSALLRTPHAATLPTMDLSSWDTSVIHAGYRRIVADVLAPASVDATPTVEEALERRRAG